MKKWLQVMVAVAAAAVMQTAVSDEGSEQGTQEPVHVLGEKLDSGLGTMVYGESLDDGLGSMVYGESLDDGLGQLTALDMRPYFDLANKLAAAEPTRQASLSY